MLPRIALAAAAAGLLAACGSGTSASPPVAPPSTTQMTVTTPTSTAPSTVAATTLPATTTTVDPEAKVIADFLATREAFNACGADPDACRVESIAAPNSTSFANLTRFFETLATEGLRGRPGPDDRVQFEDISFEGSERAIVQTCILDTGVIFDPRTSDPADDVVVNDLVTSGRTKWLLALVGGHWLRSEATVVEEQTGQDMCVPSSG